MKKEYKLDREYSLLEVVRYNLRMWWLAAILAILCAGLLGGYKYVSNYEFTGRSLYESKHQATATIMVKDYNGETATERVGTVTRIITSQKVYDKLVKERGYSNLSYEGYQALVQTKQSEVSDLASIYVTYPARVDLFDLQNETGALQFLNDIIYAADKATQELLGQDVIDVLDEPFIATKVEQVETFAMDEEEFWRGVMKGAAAGFCLGIIVEVVCFSFWMMLYKKPKDVEEIRQCLDVPVIDDLKPDADNEEAFQKVALFLKKDKPDGCLRINCISAHAPKRDVASKLAMSFANSMEKTLFIDLASGESGGMGENSISRYLLGEGDETKPIALNQYLDMVCRSMADEDGRNVVMTERFAQYVEEMSGRYAYLIINSTDVVKSADAYAVAKLCDRNMIVTGRKTVKNEELYRVKNTIDVQDIPVNGVLVYEQ